MVRLEIPGHCIQQIGLDGLRSPWRRNLSGRLIVSREIETSGRIDNTHAEQLRPEQIHGCACELDIVGEHARECYPRIFTWFGMLAG